MSWFSQNYDKAFIGAGVVAVLGAGAFFFLGQGKVEEDFQAASKGTGDAAGTPNDWKLGFLKNSLANPLKVSRKSFGDRPVDLFVGVPLFVQEDDLSESIDILKGSEIHSGIPNAFFVDNKLEIGFSDAPDRDPDGDGFSNREEFEAKTNPTDSSDFPALIDKLAVREIEKAPFEILWKGGFDGKVRLDLKLPPKVLFRSDFEAPGHIFPADGPYKGAFKFKELKKIEEANESTGVTSKSEVAVVEDLRKGMEGRTYDVRSARNPSRTLGKGYQGETRSAVMLLNAVGQEKNPFTVQEGHSFSIPPGGTEKSFSVVNISDDDVVTIGLPDGEILKIKP